MVAERLNTEAGSFLFYSPMGGPIPSEEQPDPSKLKPIGSVKVIRGSESPRFLLWAEEGSKRTWAKPELEEACLDHD